MTYTRLIDVNAYENQQQVPNDDYHFNTQPGNSTFHIAYEATFIGIRFEIINLLHGRDQDSAGAFNPKMSYRICS